jgi:hypothetical protein
MFGGSEITSPHYTKEWVDTNGQEYVFKLNDCTNVHNSWKSGKTIDDS